MIHISTSNKVFTVGLSDIQTQRYGDYISVVVQGFNDKNLNEELQHGKVKSKQQIFWAKNIASTGVSLTT